MRKALGQMQFEVRESAGFETTAEAIDGRFANPGLKGEGGDARMNGLLGGGEDHFRHFAFRFAKVFQSGLGFFPACSLVTGRSSMETISLMGEIIGRFSKNIPLRKRKR
ncbi:Uncharacterised protein [Klebsiella pneumoniae]|uniref:Uncharacterized protein n=1 Tax=Klebsiella pneumoniae TaxID=573 RepID=A0A377XEX4_KLEPN|nr:Uncharacterised protein [Klebsiella pneumoniae]